MAAALMNLLRLARAGIVLAQHGVRFVPPGTKAPLPLRLAHAATWPIRAISWPFQAGKPRERRITDALTSLGPSYIKLGQFLATRDDIIGRELAADLRHASGPLAAVLAMRGARRAVEEALGAPSRYALSPSSDPPVPPPRSPRCTRPRCGGRRHAEAGRGQGAAPRHRAALPAAISTAYFFAARMIERFHPPSRRLRPVAVVDTLANPSPSRWICGMEAAAISEMAENIKNDEGFRVPQVDWTRSARRVLTLEWIDGIPIADRAALAAAGHDVKPLGAHLMQALPRHAMRDGFFHADMHPGNLFVDDQGRIVAVDFGIMGRLGMKERRFLAEILHGFLNRDYRARRRGAFRGGLRAAQHSVAQFAQALRAIGEPIMAAPPSEISMAQLLGQLFQYTEVFDMQTRPELLLLQKTMVVVEGVAADSTPISILDSGGTCRA